MGSSVARLKPVNNSTGQASLGDKNDQLFEQQEFTPEFSQKLPRILLSVACLISALFTVFMLRPFPEFLIPVCISVSTFCLLASTVSSSFMVVLLGMSLVLSPLLGAGASELIFLSLLGPTVWKLPSIRLSKDLRNFCALLALAIVPAAIYGFRQSFDGVLVGSILEHGGIYGFYRWMLVNHSGWFEALSISRGWLVASIGLIVFSNFFRASPELAKKFFSGLLFGLIASCGWLACQVIGEPALVSFNRDPFFISEGRFGGTFSDPNAFGVVAAFLAPFIAGYSARDKSVGIFSRLVALLLVVAAFWSGTRTLLVGLGVWLVLSLVKRWSSKGSILLLASVVGIVLFAVPIITQFPSNPLIERTAKTVSIEKIKDFGKSRLLFGRIAIEAWKKKPVTGIGLGQFIESQDGFAKAALSENEYQELDGWRDNANNFYLQIAAETGIVGLLSWLSIFGVVILSFRKINSEPLTDAIVFSLVVLSVCLLTGPHFNFPEVRLLVFSLLSILFSRGFNTSNQGLPFLSLAAMGTCLYLAYISVVEDLENPPTEGLYAFEGPAVWSSGSGSFEFCNLSAQATLEFTSGHPDLESSPVTAKFESNGVSRVVTMSDNGWQKLEFEPVVGAEGRATVDFSVDRLWSPLESDIHGDARWFGLRFRVPENLCNG